MRTAAVVVTWEGGRTTERCIDSLRAQQAAPAEIIVVDNASSAAERTRLEQAVAARLGVRLIALDVNRQFAGGLNAGARVAFAAAMKRRRKVTSVDKANVLETSQLWRQTVSRIALEYPQIELDHLYVDAAAMHIITNPKRFDVILTENLFGDILSDEAAVIAGSLGMLASGTIGGAIDLYEPVHGSAPDITGLGIANPLGAIASAAMLLRHTMHLEDEASDIEAAIENVLDAGYRTRDIAGPADHFVSTSEMGQLVTEAVMEVADSRHAYHAV